MMAAIELNKSNPTYEQNFDVAAGSEITLADPSTDTKTGIAVSSYILPEGWKMERNEAGSREVGSYASASNAPQYIGGQNMASNAYNGTWILGATGSTDRALGGLTTSVTSGARGINSMVCLHNAESEAIQYLSISYDVEKYRKGNNPAGFTFQMFYSLDGENWTSAGKKFIYNFSADDATAGVEVVPMGAPVSVSANLPVEVAAGADIYLAWNLSVTSGTACASAPCYALDNVAITAGYTEMPLGSSEYCEAVTNNTFTDAGGDKSTVAYIWQTAANGDVLITIISGAANTTNVKYRGGNGLSAGINGFKVNGEAANTYFSFKKESDTVCRLTKIADVPTGAIISYEGTLEWSSKVDGVDKGNGYRQNTTKMNEYVYGTHCHDIAAPTNVAVSAAGRVSFTPGEGGETPTGYYVRIYDGATLVSQQAIENNGLLQFITEKTSYTVKVLALVDEYASAESEAATWNTYAHHVFGTSEYDHFHTSKMVDNSEVALTWFSRIDGEVAIVISGYNGTTDVTFRNQSMGSDLTKFTVLSGANFATSEPASKYFERKGGKDKDTKFRLVRKQDVALPYPCKIHYEGGYLEWFVGNTGRYHEIDAMTYTYGTTCRVNEGVPGNVSVSAMGRVKHDNVAGAEKYAAVVMKDGAIVLQQDITSGAPLNWIPTVGGTYQVTVIAFDAEGNMFDVPAETDWTVEAGHVYGITNIYVKDYGSAKNANGANNIPAYFTWETVGDNVIISIAANSDGTRGEAKFRNNALRSSDFDAAVLEKFDYTISSDKTYCMLTLKDGETAPAKGTILHFNGQVEYTVPSATGAWPSLEFSYVYGTPRYPKETTAPVIASFTGESNDYTTATLNVVASDKDDDELDQPVLTYTLSGDNDFVTTEVTPVAGVIELTDLKKNKIYHFTLTVVDPSGNSAQANAEVKMMIDGEEDVAYLCPDVTAGDSNGEGDGPSKAVNGQEGNHWGNWNYTSRDKTAADGWIQLNLGTQYTISKIDLTFATQNTYKIEASKDGSVWTEVLSNQPEAEHPIHAGLNFTAQYLRLTALGNKMIAVRHFKVYVSGYASADEVAPTINDLRVAATSTNSVTLHIEASDLDNAGNAGTVTSVKISDPANDFAELEVISELNDVTLSGLKDNTTYNFHVVVTDAAGNTASQDIEARVAFNTGVNLALASNGGSANAGGAEGANTASKAIDGSATSYWGTYGVGNWETTNVLTITLAASYNINRIAIKTGSFDGANHDATLEYSANGSDWTEFKAFVPFEANHEYDLPVVVTAQYLRFKATKNGMINIQEFEVYGSGYDDPDTEKPSISAAALVGEVGEDEATVAVTATDNVGVYACRFTSGEFSKVIDLVAGQCHLTGLVPGTTYTFSVVAIDRAGNESEPFVMESFRTVGNDAVPHTAAPAPKQNAIDVTSIYSNAYTSAVKDGFSWQAWNSSSTMKHLNIAGNDYTIYYCGAGGEFGIGANFRDAETNAEGINISNRDHLHVDVWTTEEWGLGITLNDNRLVSNYRLHEGWNSIDIALSDLQGDNAATTLANLKWMKFTEINSRTIAIDNIYFWDDHIAHIGEDDNTSEMTQYNNRYVDAVLGRAFTRGSLYTFCVPFSMDADQIEEAFGTDAQVWMMTGSEDRGSLIHIDFALQSNIVAGTPYLLRPSMDFAAGTTIEGVTISNTNGTTLGVGGAIQMHGYVNKSDFTADQHAYFLLNDAYLHELQVGATYNGLRAYFTFAASVPAGTRARIRLGETVTTDIETLDGAANIELQKVLMNGNIYIIRDGRMYNVQGQLVK